MIPGFSDLPVLYLYFFRRFVLKLNMMMMMSGSYMDVQESKEEEVMGSNACSCTLVA